MAIDFAKMYPEFAGAKVTFGLVAQGHIPTVERMLGEGQSWDDIGAAIGWCPKTAEEHWNWHVEDRATKST